MKPHTHPRSLGGRALEILSLLAVIGFLLAGCTETRYVAIPTPQPQAAPYLQACASHAARGERRVMGSSFRMLQLEQDNLTILQPSGPVGRQPVAWAYDGEGTWFGRPYGTQGEWRRVRFHCLVSPQGQVVYSFLKGK